MPTPLRRIWARRGQATWSFSGAASSFISLPFESLGECCQAAFQAQGGGVVDINLKALRAGRLQCWQVI
ncbi:MAG: hypothetical protein MZV63_00245 [Marinilabiliales bacterium]|nr:hypothetical protein [Marinilabiliales bacterium]